MKREEAERIGINRLVGEHVMGVNPVCTGKLRLQGEPFLNSNKDPYYHHYCRECGLPLTTDRHYLPDLPKEHERNYPDCAKDMNAAWQVVMKMTEPPRNYAISIEQRATRFAFWFEKANLWAMSAEEAATVICMKALELCGIVDP